MAMVTASMIKMVPTIPVIRPVKYAIAISMANIHLITLSDVPIFFLNKLLVFGKTKKKNVDQLFMEGVLGLESFAYVFFYRAGMVTGKFGVYLSFNFMTISQ